MKKDTYKEYYDNLSDIEKHIINTTALSIDEIKHYEKFLSRKITTRELKIAAVLSNNGCILIETDFKP